MLGLCTLQTPKERKHRTLTLGTARAKDRTDSRGIDPSGAGIRQNRLALPSWTVREAKKRTSTRHQLYARVEYQSLSSFDLPERRIAHFLRCRPRALSQSGSWQQDRRLRTVRLHGFIVRIELSIFTEMTPPTVINPIVRFPQAIRPSLVPYRHCREGGVFNTEER